MVLLSRTFLTAANVAVLVVAAALMMAGETTTTTTMTPALADNTTNTGPTLTVIPQLFQLEGESNVSNVKLWWALVPNASYYLVSEPNSNKNNNTVLLLANVTGDSVDVYGLVPNTNTTLTVSAYDSNTTTTTTDNAIAVASASADITVSPYTPSSSDDGGEWRTYNNSEPSSLVLRANSFYSSAQGLYYTYSQSSNTTTGYPTIVAETSTDGGQSFGNATTVLDSDTICAPTGGACKVERAEFLWNPVTEKVVFWGHFENAENYNLGEVCTADGALGDATFTYYGSFQPLGHDSRDMSVFADGPNAYLFSATDVNVNMNVYNLTANWTAVESLVEVVNKNQYREAPAVIKSSDDYFFLFTSRASGWYPSMPEYISAKDIGNWSTTPYIVGNTATFCSQSGNIKQVGNDFVMLADRWSSYWNPPQNPNREIALPIAIAGDRATFNYYPIVKYQDGKGLYGVQYGKILSQGKTNVTASSGSVDDARQAVAGTQDDTSLAYTPSDGGVPFWLEVDLEDLHQVTQTNLATPMTQGSEAYYQYTITASADGVNYDTIEDQSANTDVGFSTGFTNSTSTKYRYVRLNVQTAVNTHNGHAYPYGAGVQLLQVYGW